MVMRPMLRMVVSRLLGRQSGPCIRSEVLVPPISMLILLSLVRI